MDTLRRGAGAGLARARRDARPGATRAAEPRRAAEDTADIAPRGVAHGLRFCQAAWRKRKPKPPPADPRRDLICTHKFITRRVHTSNGFERS